MLLPISRRCEHAMSTLYQLSPASIVSQGGVRARDAREEGGGGNDGGCDAGWKGRRNGRKKRRKREDMLKINKRWYGMGKGKRETKEKEARRVKRRDGRRRRGMMEMVNSNKKKEEKKKKCVGRERLVRYLREIKDSKEGESSNGREKKKEKKKQDNLKEIKGRAFVGQV